MSELNPSTPKKFDNLTANFFDRIEKLRKPAPQSSNTTAATSTGLPQNLFTNLAISFNKSRSSEPIIPTTQSQQAVKSLLVIDDADFDDPEQDSPIIQNKPVNFPKSQSSSSQLNAVLKSDLTNSDSSQCDIDLTLKPKKNSKSSELGLMPSSSLYKLGSQVFDDINQKYKLVDEADNLKKRLFVKKKSLELSIDNIQVLKQSESSGNNVQRSDSVTRKEDQVNIDKDEKIEVVGKVSEASGSEERLAKNVVEVKGIIINSKNTDINDNNLETTTTQKTQSTLADTLMSMIRSRLVQHKHLLVAALVLLLAYVVIMPRSWHYFILSYSFGLLNGLLISASLIYLLIKLDLLVYISNQLNKNASTPDTTKTIPKDSLDLSQSTADDLVNNQIHSLLIQSAIYKENRTFDGVYKGWMNELREKYSPDEYFLNKTRSVYVNLDGTMLRIQTTNSRVPKRAMCGERIDVTSFNKLRIYDLTNSSVEILPSELCRKRFWSKKYPLFLSGVKLVSSSAPPPTSPNSNTTSPTNSTPDSSFNTPQRAPSFDTKLEPDKLILFARTDREKEEWFKLFNKSAAKHLPNSLYSKRPVIDSVVTNLTPTTTSTSTNLNYSTSNDKIIYRLNESSNEAKTGELLNQTSEQTTQTENGLVYDSSLAFMNTFIIRLFADFFTHQYWISKIQTRMQNKLNTIKLPYFMESLNIINLNLGSVVPLIKQASEPWYDERGLWVHLDVDYSGGVEIIISTKLNLMKLKAANGSSGNGGSVSGVFTFKNDEQETVLMGGIADESGRDESKSSSPSGLEPGHKRSHLAIVESEAEDSPESSGDEYTHEEEVERLVETANTGKKLMNFVSKIAASNYFQKATENKYVRMAMENVSNCQLNLNVEVKRVSGKVALNIPPHPSDRIWYGFVDKPIMVLVARPQVGEKEVSYAAISDWIAEKLKQEFQKVLVFPNMDDFYIPILNSEVNYKNW